jgi:hypothetical protein
MSARARFSVSPLYTNLISCGGVKGFFVPLSVIIATSAINEDALVSILHVLDAGNRLSERRKMLDELNISFSFAHVNAQLCTTLPGDLNALFHALNVGDSSCVMVVVKGNAVNV